MILSEQEAAFCIVALDEAAKNLMEGAEAAARLNLPLDKSIPETAEKMRALHDKMLAQLSRGAAA